MLKNVISPKVKIFSREKKKRNKTANLHNKKLYAKFNIDNL